MTRSTLRKSKLFVMTHTKNDGTSGTEVAGEKMVSTSVVKPRKYGY
jgi:hypothetical protein